MDLPPSGWYPDPYGTPQLLRWWDGSTWTQHTHPEVSAGGGEAATAVQSAVQTNTGPTNTGPTNTGQPTAGQPATGQPTTGQPTAGQPTAGQPAVRPSAERLSKTRPPSGPPTSPQPALPATTVQPAVRPTAYQAAVTSVQPTTVQPTTVQPTTVQPTTVQPTTVQPATGQPSGPPGPADGSSTQVLFTNPWESPAGSAWQPPGGVRAFGGTTGYADAQRRRRRLLMGGLAVGTAAAIAVIGIIVANLGGSPSSSAAADATSLKPTATPSPTVSASSTASPTPSPSASASAAGAVLSDGQSGLSYTELSTPWQGTSCPSGLDNGAFTWTAGEAAVAGPVNGGQTTWYGEACSGPLPLQYGYNGVGALQNTAENLANTFESSYYNPLVHTFTPEVSQPVQVSGHAGWEVTYQVSYTNATAEGATWSDEQAAVLVVDAGTGNTPAVFFTSIPGNLDESNVNSLVSSLQLSAVPSPSVSPSSGNAGAASDGVSDQASDGSGNGGNNP